MHCHGSSAQDRHRHGQAGSGRDGKKGSIILIGQPNVGKSAVFGGLTGRYMTVSNYPGTTVEVSSGSYLGDSQRQVVDTPGVNSLVPHSEDERVARDILLEEGDKVVVQVADAKNLRRALMLSLQLAEMGLPFVLDLNMSDEARERGLKINTEQLSQTLGVPVVETVAVQSKGIPELKASLEQAKVSSFRWSYPPEVEQAVGQLTSLLPSLSIASRAAALMLLSGDDSLKERLRSQLTRERMGQIEAVVVATQKALTEPLSYVLGRERARAADRVLKQVTSMPPRRRDTIADFLGKWTMHPVAGLPFVLLILFLLYEVVGVFGAGTVVNFVESVIFGEYINVWITNLVELLPIPLIVEMIVGPYGLITVGLTYALAIVLPIMVFFFIGFGILEDVGYLPRLAVLLNKGFKAIGLSGKAVLPMVLGLGCDTMATMTTRILESKRERIIATLLLVLAIPCSAQMGVILGMLAALSPVAFVLFGLIIASQLFLVGFLASRVMPGKSSDFVVEVPPFRLPRLDNILTKTLYRVEWYLKEAVPLFLLGTLLLFLSDKVGLLGLLERIGAPITTGLLNLPVESTSSFILGFLRRDYGAAGFFTLAEAGKLSGIQVIVSLVTLTLFVPCIANFFVIIKERGLRTALAMVAFIFPYAFLAGGATNFALRALGVTL